MTLRCGYPTTTTGEPCRNPVRTGSDRCAADHPVATAGYERSAASNDPARFSHDDLVAPEGDWPPHTATGWYDPTALDVERHGEYVVSRNRIEGALLGVIAGDCLGSSVEFMSEEAIAARYPAGHREIIGGGPFGWRPGQGTDDSDLTMALVEAYADPSGFSVKAAADNFLAWKKGGPRDIGGTTATALSAYETSGDYERSGRTDDRSAANGGLMRAIATGIVRRDPEQRQREAQQVSAVTHAEPRCLDAATIYCDIAGRLMVGTTPDEAINWALEHSPASEQVKDVVRSARTKRPEELDTSGYVLGSLGVAVWAISQRDASLEQTLVKVVSLGKDTDTTGAIAGGLLGAAWGASAIPARWVERLEYAPRIKEISRRLADVRFESGVPPLPPAGERKSERRRRPGLFRRGFGRR